MAVDDEEFHVDDNVSFREKVVAERLPAGPQATSGVDVLPPRRCRTQPLVAQSAPPLTQPSS